MASIGLAYGVGVRYMWGDSEKNSDSNGRKSRTKSWNSVVFSKFLLEHVYVCKLHVRSDVIGNIVHEIVILLPQRSRSNCYVIVYWIDIRLMGN